MNRSTRKHLAAAALLAGMVGVTTVPVGAEPAQVTTGAFHSFSADPGGTIGGRAQMIRTADGKTIVSVHLDGLEPDAFYAVHVHSGDCATNATGGGHYFFSGPVDGGAGPAGNEMWPGPVLADDDGVANGKAKVGATAGADAASVVVHRSTAAPNKVACADLS
jgi:hypothetical protein